MTPQNQEDIYIKKKKIKKLTLLFILCVLFVYLGYCIGGYYEWKSSEEYYGRRFEQECLLPAKEGVGGGSEPNFLSKYGTMQEEREYGFINKTIKTEGYKE